MMAIVEILQGAALPAALCAAVCVAGWRPNWAVAIGLGVAYLAAHLTMEGWPGIRPSHDWQWLLHLAAAAVVVGVAEGRVPQGAPRWGLRAGLAAFAGWALAGRLDPHWLWWGITAVVILLNIALLERAARGTPGVSFPLALCVATVGASTLLFKTGNAELGELAAVLAASLGVVFVLAWRWSAVRLGGPEITVVAVLLTGLLMSASFGRVPPWIFVVAALAPAAAVAADHAPSQWRRRPDLVRVGAVAVVTGGALTAFFLMS